MQVLNGFTSIYLHRSVSCMIEKGSIGMTTYHPCSSHIEHPKMILQGSPRSSWSQEDIQDCLPKHCLKLSPKEDLMRPLEPNGQKKSPVNYDDRLNLQENGKSKSHEKIKIA